LNANFKTQTIAFPKTKPAVHFLVLLYWKKATEKQVSATPEHMGTQHSGILFRKDLYEKVIP
jgi:hypothetical protein